MIVMVWREIKGFVIAGMLVPVVAYASGSTHATLGWLLAMFSITGAVLLVKAVRCNHAGQKPQASEQTAEDMASEMNSLVQQIAQSATDTTGQVRAELAQVKSLLSDAIVILLDSFSGLNRESREQNTMIHGVLNNLSSTLESRSQADDVLQEVVEISDVIAGQLKQVSEVTGRTDALAANAVRSLQFEDIVRQLAESSEGHLDCLERMLAVVVTGVQELHAAKLDSAGYLHGLHELRLQLKQLQADSDRAGKVVAQSSMETGDVDLL